MITTTYCDDCDGLKNVEKGIDNITNMDMLCS